MSPFPPPLPHPPLLSLISSPSQELHTLLSTPLVSASPLIRDEILLENSRCQSLLSKSVGVKVTEHTATPAPTGALQIDGGLVAALLQTAKGKKLMARSLALLPADQRLPPPPPPLPLSCPLWFPEAP
jgi:hypothetical protein